MIRRWWRLFREYPPTRAETLWALASVVFWLWYWRCSP